MTLPPIYSPPGGPPQGPLPSPEIYARLGQDGIFRMCRDFYAQLERSPIRPMFPPDMAAASEKLACFLVGLLGGPPLYQQRFGPPRMRARHLPFAIDQAARDAWLGAFLTVLEDAPEAYGFPPEHMEGFCAFLERFSLWMINRAPSP